MFRKSKLKAHHKFLDIGCGIGSIVLQAAAWAGCQAAVSEAPVPVAADALTPRNRVVFSRRRQFSSMSFME